MKRLKIHDRDWDAIQAYYDKGYGTRQIQQEFKISIETLMKASEMGLFRIRSPAEARELMKGRPRKPVSAEGRRHMSEAKKKWNRENPEKVRAVFSKLSKQKSVPCEHLKTWLRSQNIIFVEEYQPMLEQDRYYSVDIAFPDKKIGVEVNGDMHYGPDGKLREYYQIRHDTIEAQGWLLYEVPRKFVFNVDKMIHLFTDILSAATKQQFDFLSYIPPIKKKDMPKPPKIKRPPTYKYQWPANEELRLLVYQKSLTAIAKEYGSVANTLKDHCLREGITYPPVGYWRRREAGYTHEEAMVSQKKSRLTDRRAMNPEEIDVASRLRHNGWSYTRIGEHLGFASTCISDTLRKRGIVGRANWSRWRKNGEVAGIAPA